MLASSMAVDYLVGLIWISFLTDLTPFTAFVTSTAFAISLSVLTKPD